ncbi:MAG: sigma-70 family RNA polymerase sigma factor, partial [Brevinematales bacterium]
DIIQNGNIGLMKAADKFNPALGVKFSTYAAFWIKQSILRGFIKPSLSVSISYRKDEINKRIKNYIREHFSMAGKMPEIQDIIKDLKVKRRDVIDIIMLYKGNGEFQYGGGSHDTENDLADMVQDNSYNPESVFEKKKLKEDVLTAVDSFPDREKDIIKNRFGLIEEDKKTLNRLGDKYAISAEATRQIEKKVLAHIRMRFPYLAYYYYAY